ncbi:MAG: hypothetical protein AAGA44_00300 [Pseudomonadota bacterium]
MGQELAQLTSNLFGLGWLWTIIITLASLAIAIVGAVFVFKDAEKRAHLYLDLHPLWWAGTALIFSLYGVALYWLLHRSTLASPADSSAASA